MVYKEFKEDTEIYKKFSDVKSRLFSNLVNNLSFLGIKSYVYYVDNGLKIEVNDNKEDHRRVSVLNYAEFHTLVDNIYQIENNSKLKLESFSYDKEEEHFKIIFKFEDKKKNEKTEQE